jgi:hypothetical protein
MLAIGCLERSKRLNRILFLIVLVLFIGKPVQTQWKLDQPFHTQVTSGIDLILKQEYDQADSLFRDFAQRYPDHPVGYLYQAAVMQAYALDFDNPIPREKFDSLLELGKKTAVGLQSPWREYFLATAEGHDAYERAERGDWFGGVRNGMASASKYEEVLEHDSTFYDAYIGLGTYYYWRSRKTAFIRWLPFVNDDRERGIKMLIVGAERSEYNRFAAISSLISIYTDAENYTAAVDWSNRGLQFYPENRIFLWGLATALDRDKRSAGAVRAYTNLLQSILHANPPHPYGEIVCRLNLSKSKLTLDDTTEVVVHLKKILSYQKSAFPENLRQRVQAKFEAASSLLSEMKKRQAVSK